MKIVSVVEVRSNFMKIVFKETVETEKTKRLKR